MQEVEILAGGAILTTLEVLLALAAIWVIIDRTIDIYKKWRKPSNSVLKRLDAVEARLESDKIVMLDFQEGQQLLMQGVTELIAHELHNGNTDAMEKVDSNMRTWLINRTKVGGINE